MLFRSIDNRGQAAIARHQKDDHAEWLTAARADLTQELAPFGVVLERLDFTQLGIGVALKNIESGNWHEPDQHDAFRLGSAFFRFRQ